jgi:hypothetical protein
MSLILLGILNSQAAAAGGGGPAYDLLETQTLGTAAASVTFTGLGSYTDYKHLQIRAVTESSRADGSSDSLRMRFNSDSGSNYADHELIGNGSSVTSGGGTTDPFMFIGQTVSSTTANAFGSHITDILDFASSDKNTTIRTFSGFIPSTNSNVQMRSGLYKTTSAITAFEVYCGEGNLTAGSRFSLYGVK